MIGEDELAASMQGIDVTAYLEPKNFGVMLGVHGLVYGLIGGLVAVLLIFRHRGLLDEELMHRLRRHARQICLVGKIVSAIISSSHLGDD